MTPRGPAAAHDDQDSITLDGLRDRFFVAHRACERFSKMLGGVAQKLQDSKADDPWLTEVCLCVCGVCVRGGGGGGGGTWQMSPG